MAIGDIRETPLAMNEGPNWKTAGRLTGLVYLVMIVSSAAGYATMTRLLAGDPPMVLERLALDYSLFRLAFAAMAIGFVAWVMLAIMLYRLMSPWGRFPALLMLIFTVAGAAMNLAALSELLPLVNFSRPGIDVRALASAVESYNHVLVLAQVFSGLWMFPFGWLVIRSRLTPRPLGYCLIVGGVGYLLIPVGAFNPGLNDVLASRIVSLAPGIPAMAGELGVCLWLLIKGARAPTRDAR